MLSDLEQEKVAAVKKFMLHRIAVVVVASALGSATIGARGLAVPFGYYDDWYSGYYDPSTVTPDEQSTYPVPVVTPPRAPNAYVVFNPHSAVPSEEPDLLRPGELLVRFPPPKKISR